MEQESNYSRGDQPFDLDLGDLFEIEYLREDESIEVEFERLKTIIEAILYNEKIIGVPFVPDKQRADYLKGKWDILQDKELRKNGETFPCENYFLRENRDPELSYEKLKELGIDPLYNYDLYSYTTRILITPESNWISLEDYLFIAAFKIRQLDHARIVDFLDFQNQKYWEASILEKIEYFALDYPHLISENKLSIIKEWVLKSPKSIKTMESKELRDSPELTIRESCMLFFVLLKGLDAWPDETNEITQSKVVDLIHVATGYSKDGIKKKINKDTFLEEDGQHEKSTSKVKRLLELLNSNNISDISSKQL
jgi:hypothetical protein